MAKKKAAKKAAKRTAPPSKPPAKPAEQPKEIDPKELPPEEAKKRCAAIYALEKKLKAATSRHDVAKRAAKAAKDAVSAAREALDKEIEEQRFGPGPLFPPDAGHAGK